MKKTKLQKGITLIALIITIVVLLIIAVVTIGAVQESGIIGHAQNAATDYKTKADEENTILDGYWATIEDNIPGEGDSDSEPVSIVGKYGNDATTAEKEYYYEYYIFNEDETGKYFERDGARETEKNFTYTLIDISGTITMDDNEEKTFTFQVARDSNGNILNKVIIVDEYNDGTFLAYTTNENVGFSNIDGTTYNELEGDEEVLEVSFENGKCIVQYEDETSDFGRYFKIGDYIYTEEGMSNRYSSCFQIIDNKLKSLAS